MLRPQVSGVDGSEHPSPRCCSFASTNSSGPSAVDDVLRQDGLLGTQIMRPSSSCAWGIAPATIRMCGRLMESHREKDRNPGVLDRLPGFREERCLEPRPAERHSSRNPGNQSGTPTRRAALFPESRKLIWTPGVPIFCPGGFPSVRRTLGTWLGRTF